MSISYSHFAYGRIEGRSESNAEQSSTSYRHGDRIRLLVMDDPDPVPFGSTGTITGVRNMGEWLQIDVDWDNGRALMLSVPPDRVEICK